MKLYYSWKYTLGNKRFASTFIILGGGGAMIFMFFFVFLFGISGAFFCLPSRFFWCSFPVLFWCLLVILLLVFFCAFPAAFSILLWCFFPCIFSRLSLFFSIYVSPWWWSCFLPCFCLWFWGVFFSVLVFFFLILVLFSAFQAFARVSSCLFFVPRVAPKTNNHNILHFGPCIFWCFSGGHY